MDKISELPDELLVKILSFVPTKVAVSTCILSKRWNFLWMWLPDLEYSDDHGKPLLVLRNFINNNLPLHRAPVIERLCLELWELRDPKVSPKDIKLWVETAVSRYVRELEVSYRPASDENSFPISLFTCGSLVVLKLRYLFLKDVLPSISCLPSLKTLQLESVTYLDGESFQNLLSMCPVLEDLEVRFLGDDNRQNFTLSFQYLRKLTLSLPDYWDLLDWYEIDTPLLEYLKLEDWTDESPCLFKNMPNLREAYVDVVSFALKNVIGSITSVKHLIVCTQDVYGDGLVFKQLERLELCVSKDDSLNLLAKFLKDSPNLRVLHIFVQDCHGDLKTDDVVAWNQPSCMLSSLQIFSWSRYIGRPEDRDIVGYIFKNAPHLRTATFRFDVVQQGVPNPMMLKEELTLSSRASSNCELVFVETI